MIYSIKEGAKLILSTLFAAILFLYFSLVTYSLLDTEKKCLSAGYPESTIDMSLNGYCIDLYAEERPKSLPVEDLK